ncbi:MAG: glutamine synthetase family protein, partial [Actinomycetota bacterium]
MERQHEYVLRAAEERNVKLVRLWFTDVLGKLKSVAISPVELETAFEEGVHVDGSAIDGFSRVQESDVLAIPDASTFELLPWTDSGTTARMFCDIHHHDGRPFEGDPRQILRRNLARASEAGFTFFVAPEMEFFYFADDEPSHTPTLLDSGSYFDLTTSDVASDLRRRTISVLEQMGVPVEYSFHEDAPSQHEIDLRYTDAMSMADQIMTFRLVVRELALEQGHYASFMPKPLEGMQGSGMHLHLSLFSE